MLNQAKDKKENIRFVIIVFIGFLIITQLLIINGRVPSSSMYPTIDVGDRFFASRIAYWFETPERGDVIVFNHPDKEPILLVKRVIGLPGESILIENGQIYIDDQPLLDDYTEVSMIGSFGPYEVPADCYFLLGDNRNFSKDSRRWENTYVHKDLIKGKALLIYYPYIKNIS